MRYVLLVAAAAVALQASAVEANLLTNGNLDLTSAQVIVDNAPAGPGPEDFFLPKPQFWTNEAFRTITGPTADDLSSEPWAGPLPTPVTTDGLSNPPHPDGCGGGDCGVFFKPFAGNSTNGPITSHLYQDVPGTPGATYKLTGWAGAEANALMAGAEFAIEFLNAANAIIGGTVLDLMPTLFIDNGLAFDYKRYTLSGVAPAGTESVRVRVSMLGGQPNPSGGGQAFVVDDFTLTVPSPAALPAGVALVALMATRRRRA